MTTKPSFAQLVTQALSGAGRPLTLAEIQARVEMVRPVNTRDPHATLRGAIQTIPLAVTLGGRPAHYTWWPRHLAGNAFRQPLAGSDLEAGTLVLGEEVRLALWPDFFADPSRSTSEVTLDLARAPTVQARIEPLATGQAGWGLLPAPALAAWYRGQGAAPEDDLVIRVLDVDTRYYAVSLVHRADRNVAGIAARNRALADTAETVLRTAYIGTPDFVLVPRLIAHGAYRDPLPPDPWEDVLRADLRFVVGNQEAYLADRLKERPVDPPGFSEKTWFLSSLRDAL